MNEFIKTTIIIPIAIQTIRLDLAKNLELVHCLPQVTITIVCLVLKINERGGIKKTRKKLQEEA